MPQLSLPQAKVMESLKALTLNMAGQGGGKSYGIGLRSGMRAKYFPKMVGMLAANTYKQLTQSTLVEVRKVWKKEFFFTEYHPKGNPDGVYVVNRKPPQHFVKYQEFDSYDGIISWRNGCTMFIASLDNYLVHEGKTLGWAELDETKDTKEVAIKQVILGRLRQPGLFYTTGEDGKYQAGSLIYSEDPHASWVAFNPCVINTSPAEGTVEWLLNLFKLDAYEMEINETIFDPGKYFYKETEYQAICIYSTFWNAANLAGNFIQTRMAQLSEGEIKKFIYGYPFAKTGGEYYPHFDRIKHITDVLFIPGLVVHSCWDFNLVPYMTNVAFQIHETETEIQIRIFAEYCPKPPRNTAEHAAQMLIDEYGDQIKDIFYYGDAMGSRGVEGFGDEFTRFDPIREVYYRWITDDSDKTTTYNIGVNKRRNFLNRLFEGKVWLGNKNVVLLVDRGCTEMIRDFQFLKEGANGKVKEKAKDPNTGREYEKLGHTSDAVEYGICEIFITFIV
jgi:hypothetical protein